VVAYGSGATLLYRVDPLAGTVAATVRAGELCCDLKITDSGSDLVHCIGPTGP
jgi:hypothetical protein